MVQSHNHSGAIVRTRAFHLVKSWVQFSLKTRDTYVKTVSHALPKIAGFLRVLRFPLTGNIDRVDWD